ncbi:MAG: hypothetical protein ACRDS1_06025 [Pseudonocardiaceae bacterium]
MRRAEEYGLGELVKGVHVDLTVAERTRRVVLTEAGLARYTALCEGQRAAQAEMA